jgi:hypothetical protein
MLDVLEPKAGTFWTMYFASMFSMTSIGNDEKMAVEFVEWLKATINSTELSEISPDLNKILEKIDKFVKKLFKEIGNEPVSDQRELEESARRSGFVLDDEDGLSVMTDGTTWSASSRKMMRTLSRIGNSLLALTKTLKLMETNSRSKFYESLKDPKVFQKFLVMSITFMRFRNTAARGQPTMSGFLANQISYILGNIKRYARRYRFDIDKLMMLLTCVAGSEAAQKWLSYLTFSKDDGTNPTNWNKGIYAALIVFSLKQRKSQFTDLVAVVESIFEGKELSLNQKMMAIMKSAMVDIKEKLREALSDQ